VLGVPMESKLQGLDSLLSMVQMPGGIPVGTLAIGKAGAINAALFAAAILGANHPEIREALKQYRCEYDEEKKVFSPRPLHDWTSHAADAFRYLAMGLPEAAAKQKPITYPKGSYV